MLGFGRQDAWSDFVLGRLERRGRTWNGKLSVRGTSVPFEILGGWSRPPAAAVQAVRDTDRLLNNAITQIAEDARRGFGGIEAAGIGPVHVRAAMEGANVRLEIGVIFRGMPGRRIGIQFVDGRYVGLAGGVRQIA